MHLTVRAAPVIPAWRRPYRLRAAGWFNRRRPRHPATPRRRREPRRRLAAFERPPLGHGACAAFECLANFVHRTLPLL